MEEKILPTVAEPPNNGEMPHSHICRNCGSPFTQQKGNPAIGILIGGVLIIIPFILVVLIGIDLPAIMVGGPFWIGVGVIFVSCSNRIVCPYCGNKEDNVGLHTPMGQKLYKDLHKEK